MILLNLRKTATQCLSDKPGRYLANYNNIDNTFREVDFYWYSCNLKNKLPK